MSVVVRGGAVPRGTGIPARAPSAGQECPAHKIGAARFAPWLFLVLAGSGCARVGQVSGVVSYQGKTLPAGTVTLLAGDGQPYDGAVQPDGTFTIRNVPAGAARVAVTSILAGRADSSAKGAAPTKQRTLVQGAGSRIPLKYGEFQQSGLTVAVEPGATVTLKLDLK